ncbi:MAG: nitroreductase family protein [Deltaproteobacteria bacterium]|nr:nitroreductase family protein [Deltaproteobacteria bacterium]
MITSLKTPLLVFLAAGCALAACWASAPPAALAQDTIQLPAVTPAGGKPLLEALAARHSDRTFNPDTALTDKQLSELLWSAFGVNRPDGKRTIPTAHGRSELSVFAVLKTGVYLYDPAANTLTLALAGDHTTKYAKSPLTVLYAAPDNLTGAFHAGSAYQNVGLYCASEGLANVVRTTGADELKGRLSLPEGFQVLVVQSIGLPG